MFSFLCLVVLPVQHVWAYYNRRQSSCFYVVQLQNVLQIALYCSSTVQIVATNLMMDQGHLLFLSEEFQPNTYSTYCLSQSGGRRKRPHDYALSSARIGGTTYFVLLSVPYLSVKQRMGGTKQTYYTPRRIIVEKKQKRYWSQNNKLVSVRMVDYSAQVSLIKRKNMRKKRGTIINYKFATAFLYFHSY